jgi:hypothetical protein
MNKNFNRQEVFEKFSVPVNRSVGVMVTRLSCKELI